MLNTFSLGIVLTEPVTPTSVNISSISFSVIFSPAPIFVNNVLISHTDRLPSPFLSVALITYDLKGNILFSEARLGV